jgi:hypothetical protein
MNGPFVLAIRPAFPNAVLDFTCRAPLLAWKMLVGVGCLVVADNGWLHLGL